ncbi:phosphatase PAP2 family protein [Alkalihalobacillus oceani]|uniref:phosphatase PAP2 family protein n=1 Tax=Halalkalibacter oceani TaxID=1653776 RepID=UPI00203D69E4|nr:phosphatase PAP2 family protein [Halalkalibacter oceani]MCM3760801.1 phosphatase PAP2 family protein [Halalkalibacter oceani]
MQHKSLLLLLSCGGVLLMLFLLLTRSVVTGRTLVLDEALIHHVSTLEHPFLTAMLIALSYIGSTTPVVVISIVLLIVLYQCTKKKRDIIFFTVVSLCSVSLNVLLKSYFERERPTIITMIEETGFSYPSAHAMAAFTLYGAVTFLFWRHLKKRKSRRLLLGAASCMILLMGFSRIYLGVHYPSDVIGGYLVSGTLLTISIFIYQWIQHSIT